MAWVHFVGHHSTRNSQHCIDISAQGNCLNLQRDISLPHAFSTCHRHPWSSQNHFRMFYTNWAHFFKYHLHRNSGCSTHLNPPWGIPSEGLHPLPNRECGQPGCSTFLEIICNVIKLDFSILVPWKTVGNSGCTTDLNPWRNCIWGNSHALGLLKWVPKVFHISILHLYCHKFQFFITCFMKNRQKLRVQHIV